MDSTAEKSTQPNGKTLSRRDFLKIGGAAIGVLFLGSLMPDENGNMFAGNLGTKLFTDLFAERDIKGSDETLRLIRKETNESNNQNYSPYLSILKDGVDEFQSKNPYISVVWNKNPLYVGDYETVDLLIKPIEKSEASRYSEGTKYIGKSLLECIENVIVGGNPTVPYGVFNDRLPEEIRNVITSVNTDMVAFPGTELYEKYYPKLGNVFSHKDVTGYYEQIKIDLERIYSQQPKQEPLPLSKLVVFFLEKNNGRLFPAFGDMAGFTKYLIRGDDTAQATTQIGWFRSHIQDQINKDFSLNKIPDPVNISDSELSNSINSIWGLLYHVPNLVYLLSYLSPDLVRLATVYEYVAHDHVAGGYKVKVDTEFMDGLNLISDYIQNISKK